MKLTALNSTQQKNNGSKEPSFQSNVYASKGVKKLWAKEMQHTYSVWKEHHPGIIEEHFGKKGFNFERQFMMFKRAIEKCTGGIDGNIRFVLGKDKSIAEIKFQAPDGLYLNDVYAGTAPVVETHDILPNKTLDKGEPMIYVARKIKKEILDILNNN